MPSGSPAATPLFRRGGTRSPKIKKAAIAGGLLFFHLSRTPELAICHLP